jgi:cobalt-zinc-cadmium efflux system outer membrane protein
LLVYSGRLTLPVPVWDQNKGAINQARNLLIQAMQVPTQSQLQLTNTLADAFNRYTTARQQVQVTRQQIEDQVRAFRGVYERRWQAPDDVSFGDVVAAEQTLAGYISAYITALGGQWTAVVDVANLLQTDDLFQVGKTLEEMTPVPDLEHLMPPPGCRPAWSGAGQPRRPAAVNDAAVIQVKAGVETADCSAEQAAPKRIRAKRRSRPLRPTEPSCVVLTPEPTESETQRR